MESSAKNQALGAIQSLNTVSLLLHYFSSCTFHLRDMFCILCEKDPSHSKQEITFEEIPLPGTTKVHGELVSLHRYPGIVFSQLKNDSTI